MAQDENQKGYGKFRQSHRLSGPIGMLMTDFSYIDLSG
jgi:hypothetical protein